MESNKFIPSTFQSDENTTLDHKDDQDRIIAIVVVLLFMIAVIYGCFYTLSYQESDQVVDSILVNNLSYDNKELSSSYVVPTKEKVHRDIKDEVKSELPTVKKHTVGNSNLKLASKQKKKQQVEKQHLDSTTINQIYIEDPDHMNSTVIPDNSTIPDIKEVILEDKESLISDHSSSISDIDSVFTNSKKEAYEAVDNSQNVVKEQVSISENHLSAVKEATEKSVVVDSFPKHSVIIGAFKNQDNFNKRKALALRKGYTVHTKVTSKGLYLLAVPTTSNKQDQKNLQQKVNRDFDIMSWVKVSP